VPSGRDHDSSRPERRAEAVEHRFTGALLDPEELIELVDLGADLLPGLQAHEDELAVLRRIEDLPELGVLDGERLDVLDETLHGVGAPVVVGRCWPSPWKARGVLPLAKHTVRHERREIPGRTGRGAALPGARPAPPPPARTF
jgi:hypothetical protein